MDGEKLYPSMQMSHLPIYNEEQFSAARDRILQHRQSTLKFQSELTSASGVTLSGDYTLGRISHNYFSNCSFEHASLKKAVGSGSIFRKVQFCETDLTYSTFQNSSFEQCTFDQCAFQGCNMSECYFQESIWQDCSSGAVNMTAALLDMCQFLRTKPGNLSEAVLKDSYFEDIRLTNIQLEYSSFQRLKTKNVILPFSQLPYIFGGIQYLLETSDNVRVSSHINDSDSISVDEYSSVLKDMEIFYSYKQEYFPLANILLAFQRYDEALAAILYGIKDAARQRDFRMCKYYCKLITSNGRFPDETLRGLYQAICQAAPVQSMSQAQYYQYLRHIPEIRSMLIENPNHFPHASLKLETDIKVTDITRIGILISTLDHFLHLNGSSLALPNITISHNSPVIIAISLCGTPSTILAIGALILSVIVGICKAYNHIADAILKTQEIVKNQHDLKQKDLETRKLSAELARLEHENPGLRDDVKTSKMEITKSGIAIVHASMEGQDFDPMKWL